MKMIVVVNEHGQVVAAAHAAPEAAPAALHLDPSRAAPSCVLGALPGQRMELVELPEHLHALDVEQRLRAMLDHRMAPGAGSLEYAPRTKE